MGSGCVDNDGIIIEPIYSLSSEEWLLLNAAFFFIVVILQGLNIATKIV